ncbi:MAG: peptidoglycan-binding domain-containing protein [Rhodovibrio sp.]|nr:peptidoglycan-binding domain-containing protein [Rhodovibrio sp.]
MARAQTLSQPGARRKPGGAAGVRRGHPVDHGGGGADEPDDVTRLQRALSETGDYAFTAPRERSGAMSANLETALTRYQRRTGLDPDGVAAPNGPTVQQIAAGAERGCSDTSARTDLTRMPVDHASLKGHRKACIELLTQVLRRRPLKPKSNETAKSDGANKRKSQCGNIRNELHAAHERLNDFSDNARDKSIEIESMRKAIAKVANLEEFGRTRSIGMPPWARCCGPFSRPVAVAYDMPGDIVRITNTRDATRYQGRLQELLDES